MELIYLWVEDYKNIKEQGFNFSGRYQCEYDKEKKELTIEENKGYVHIFPKNISVTAIVGKNGSGKSTLLEFLKLCLSTSMQNSDSKYILVFAYGADRCYKSNIEYLDIKLSNCSGKQFSTISYYYDKPYHEMKQNFIIGETKINLSEQDIYQIIIQNGFNENLKLAPFMFTPSFLTVKSGNKIDKIFDQSTSRNTSNKISKKILDAITMRYHKFLVVQYIEKNSFFMQSINENLDGIHCDNIADYSILENVGRLEEELTSEPIHTESMFNSFFSNPDERQNKKINHLTILEKEIYSRYYNYFETFSLWDTKNRRYEYLSSGEKLIFGILLNIYMYALKFTTDIFFILDEPNEKLHPEWQAKYIKMLIDSISSIKDRRFCFAISSHSPFLLSDIPSQNVIFLDKDENENCKVVDGLRDKKQTFGANIHTLLSDAFFMEDGLMGEYAKTKINELIDYLNGKESPIKDDDEAQKYIRIIGEPILKKQLQRMLDSKRLSKIDEIDLLKAQMSEIEKKLKKLENSK